MLSKSVSGFFTRLRDATREIHDVRSLAGTSMFAALTVILDRIATFQVSQILEIGFSFIAVGASAYLYGPWLAGLSGVVVDILAYFLRPNGGFFVGFTLNQFLLGFIYGCWLYKKPVTLWRCAAACLSVVLVLNLCLTPVWLHLMYGNSLVLSTLRIVKNIIKFPVDTALLYVVLKFAEVRLVPHLRRM